MGQIFAASKQVLAWLGGSPNGLLENPWFRRVWVMQEVIMAPRIVRSGLDRDQSCIRILIEDDVIDFDILETAIEKLESARAAADLVYSGQDQRASTLTRYRSMLIFARHRHARLCGPPFSSEREISIVDILADTWAFESTDPRDKIFAVNKFAKIPEESKLRPDYESSVEEIHIRYAVQLIPTKPSLLLLSGIGQPRSYLDLPSWVPDFNCSCTSGIQVLGAGRGRYDAGDAEEEIDPKIYSHNKLHTDYGIEVDFKHLNLEIIHIDTINKIFKKPSVADFRGARATSKVRSKDRRAYYLSMLTWLEQIKLYTELVQPTKNQSDHDFIQTITAYYSASGSRWYPYWYQGLVDQAGHRPSNNSSEHRVANAKRTAIQETETTLGDDPVFVTRDRIMIGFGPRGLREDDAVCVALGVSTPLLLRENAQSQTANTNSTGEKKWNLVGCCYVHGLIYGEGLSMGQPERSTIV